jgi:ribose transport system substrate-binding protein
MSVHGLRNLVGALVLGAALVAVAGCGDSESGGGSAGQGGGPGVAEAQTIAEKATTRPTTLGFTKAIGKDVPAGKKVAFISCGVEACEIQGDIIKQGAADLG